MTDLETRLALLERDMEDAMQVIEGVRFIAERAEKAHSRIDRLGDATVANHDALVAVRAEMHAVELRREKATQILGDSVLAAVADVKEDVAKLDARMDRFDDRIGAQVAARIISRGTITVAALSGFLSLLTFIIGGELGVGK